MVVVFATETATGNPYRIANSISAITNSLHGVLYVLIYLRTKPQPRTKLGQFIRRLICCQVSCCFDKDTGENPEAQDVVEAHDGHHSGAIPKESNNSAIDSSDPTIQKQPDG